MKIQFIQKITFFSILFIFVMNGSAQYYVNVQNNFGYTHVNISEAMDIPEYSEITDEGLVGWDHFNYKGLLQIYKKVRSDLHVGGEVGFHRLYYWEKKFYPSLTGSARWNWGTICTIQTGGLVKRIIAYQYYVITGASAHVFLNGTGVTIGFPFAIGHEIKLSNKVIIPVEFRLDIIFGKAVPIGLGGGIGIQYHLKY